MTQANSLKSTGISKLLLNLLLIELFFPLLPFIGIRLNVFVILFAFSFILLISFIVFAIWIQRIHVDLKNLFADYPITPGGALTRILIPFLNFIWGFQNTINTFAERFNQEGGLFSSKSKKVKQLIRWFYFFIVIPIFFSGRTAINFPPEIKLILLLICDVGSTVVLLQLIKTMQALVIQKTKQKVEQY